MIRMLAEELGDLLLQVVFHAQIAKENGCCVEPLATMVAKMRRRHPHVFADVHVNSSAEVMHNWEAIKAKERSGEPSTSLLARVPRNMPSLLQAYKVQEKAAQVGFDWDDIHGAWSKVEEEQQELLEAVRAEDTAKISEELGDLLFAIVNVARFLQVEPETALLSTVIKFRHRFAYIEQQAQAAGRSLEDYTLEELDQWWNEAKNLSAELD